MNCIPCADNQIRVFVTGFGSFSSNGVNIDVNASGEAIKRLDKEALENKLNITLVTEEVPVEYKFVDHVVPKIIQEIQPDLAIHVGVSDMTEGFSVEKQARKASYEYEDGTQCCPEGAENPCDGPECLATDLEVELICKEFNSGLPEDHLPADMSDDAGNYVCEYMYYTSLRCQMDGNRKSLFIHVPYSTEEEHFERVARGLERLIEICVNHIRTQGMYIYERSQSLDVEFNM